MANILIVDDNPDLLRVLARIVEGAGHECVSVSGGREAIEKFGNRSFDVAIVDLMMPEMDGTELIDWMSKEAQNTRAIPMSAITNLLIAPSKLTDGVCLTKPFRLEEVYAVLDEALEVSSGNEQLKGKGTIGMTGSSDDQHRAERRTDHKLRERVTNLLGEVRDLHGQLPVMEDDDVEAAHRRFLKYADMIWDRLLEGDRTRE